MIDKGQIVSADIKIRYKYKAKYKEEWVKDAIFSRPYKGDYPKLDKESLFFKRFMPNPNKRHDVCDIELLNMKNVIKVSFKNNR
jgi:hypothetical protein